MDWIAVGLGQDLRHGMAMPGRINGIDLAVWRSATGQVHVWGDRCPHRGMRLSHGFVRGETLSCIYHGWQYDADGGCVAIPAHPKLTPPKSICATTYHCQESDGVIWVALEPAESAPPDLSGYNAVRSLPVEASLSDVTTHFGASETPIVKLKDPAETIVVVQPRDTAQSILHVLAKADFKKVSRWIEAQRSLIEGMQA